MTAQQMEFPLARRTDPVTSQLAGLKAKRSRKELVDAITKVLHRCGPLTHEQIVAEVEEARPDYWQPSTIVSGCASACLHVWDYDFNTRGGKVTVWSLEKPDEPPRPIDNVVVLKGRL